MLVLMWVLSQNYVLRLQQSVGNKDSSYINHQGQMHTTTLFYYLIIIP